VPSFEEAAVCQPFPLAQRSFAFDPRANSIPSSNGGAAREVRPAANFESLSPFPPSTRHRICAQPPQPGFSPNRGVLSHRC
jgi:hypothetical protein